jgi:hypothetical protein
MRVDINEWGQERWALWAAHRFSSRTVLQEHSCTVCRVMPDGSVKDLSGKHWANAHQAIKTSLACQQHLLSDDHIRRATDGRMALVPEHQRHPAVFIRGRAYNQYACRDCSLDVEGLPRQEFRNITEETLLQHRSSKGHKKRVADGRYLKSIYLLYPHGRPVYRRV